MSLRCRIVAYYAVTLSISLLIVGYVSYFEFSEQKDRDEATIGRVVADEDDSPLEETIEIILGGGLPAILVGIIGAMVLEKRAMRPVEDLTMALETTDINNLGQPVPSSGNGDELDRMTVVFNRTRDRLNTSFVQAREFTLHASHELKTPLTIIHSTLEQIFEDPTMPAKHRERIVSMLEEVQRLSGIVVQLAFLAKADAGLLSESFQPVALHELVEELAENVTVLATNSGISVTQVERAHAIIVGDRMRLRQLLLNLADNAVKYNRPGGSVTLALSLSGDQVRFQITNTGPPLPSELRPRVFDRFFRGDASHSGSIEGTGLGLSIAHSIAKAHGGDLTFKVLEDDRTELTLTLPLEHPRPGPKT